MSTSDAENVTWAALVADVHMPYFDSEENYLGESVLASELPRIVATAQAAALRQARDDIKSRIDTFRSLGADERYMDALNDAWGLVANRLRDAEASSLPPVATNAQEADRG